jgi:hypothetical protein
MFFDTRRKKTNEIMYHAKFNNLHFSSDEEYEDFKNFMKILSDQKMVTELFRAAAVAAYKAYKADEVEAFSELNKIIDEKGCKAVLEELKEE